jgi:hypothetical protein
MLLADRLIVYFLIADRLQECSSLVRPGGLVGLSTDYGQERLRLHAARWHRTG